jgi:hypothetical protein
LERGGHERNKNTKQRRCQGKMSCTTAKSPFERKPFMDVCRSKGSI